MPSTMKMVFYLRDPSSYDEVSAMRALGGSLPAGTSSTPLYGPRCSFTLFTYCFGCVVQNILVIFDRRCHFEKMTPP
jgi:hypothetical protein